MCLVKLQIIVTTFIASSLGHVTYQLYIATIHWYTLLCELLPYYMQEYMFGIRLIINFQFVGKNIIYKNCIDPRSRYNNVLFHYCIQFQPLTIM